MFDAALGSAWVSCREINQHIVDIWQSTPGRPESELDRRVRVQAGHDAKFQEILEKNTPCK